MSFDLSASPQSLGALLRASCQAFPERNAMLIPGGKGFEPVTYKQLYADVRRWTSGVRSLGLSRGDRLCILSENCREWALLDWACQTLGIVVVPIYPTLPSDQACYIVEDCGAKVVACGDAKQLAKVECLSHVRSFLIKGSEKSIEQMASEAALIADEVWNPEIDAAKLEDVATIIYTSGTTGLPKGALLPHRAFVWMNKTVVENIPVGKDDTWLSFLPLSHVYERANGHFLPISLGATIAYSKNLSSLASDIATAKPTLILVVPRFLEATMDRITDAVKKSPPLRQKLFALTLSQGKKRQTGGFAPLYPILDKLVGTKIRERLGGRLRFFVSGGAALPRHVFDFYDAFRIPIQQGYGLTETTSGIAMNNPDHPNRPDTVGEVFQGMECKIAEDGEILLRGPAIMLGYYNLPVETAAAIDAEGWFHTGDIGELEGRLLKITDRKKDIIVLGSGKNVAPQPIENKLRASAYIAEAVVLGDNLDHCIALIVPNFELLKARFGGDNESLIEHPEVKALIKRDIDAVNKTGASFEMVKRHALIPAPFTIEGGELTPTLKVKRKVVTQKYASIIAELT